MTDLEIFLQKYTEQMAQILQERSKSEAELTKKIADAEGKVKMLEDAKSAAAAAFDTEAYSKAIDELSNAAAVLAMLRAGQETRKRRNEPDAVNGGRQLLKDAKSMKDKLSADALGKVYGLLTEAEKTLHQLDRDLTAVDNTTGDWHSKRVSDIYGAAGTYNGTMVESSKAREAYTVAEGVTMIHPYRASHGHTETSFSGFGPHWTIE